MKKRLISCLALLLMLSTLLCSCAEGLPLSEMYFAAKNAVTKYTTQLKHLQEGSKAVTESGKSEYVISLDRNTSKEVKDAVTTLIARIKKQTGVELSDSTKEGEAKRIVIGMPREDAVAKVTSASQFYVGFEQDDLIIQATNDIMLISAITYFAENYLSDEEKDLVLSPDLSYLSPTATYRSKEHNLIRAEKTGLTATQAASSFCDTLFDTAGVRFSVKSDFNAGGGRTDILFGYPDDAVAQSILNTLSFDDFYIGVREGKLMILAKNDPALAAAAELFLSTFVTAGNATFDTEEKTLSLPAVCDYYYRSDAILLADEGINRAVLIYSENASDTTKNAAKNFANLYKRLTNTELPIHKDTEYSPNIGSVEILVGETNRSFQQLNYLESSAQGTWAINVLPEENAISVFAKGQLALLCALDQLGKELTRQTRAISKDLKEEDQPLYGDTDRTLYIRPSLALSGKEPPDFPVAGSYVFHERQYRFASSLSIQVHEYVWSFYDRRIQQYGFQRYSKTEENGVVTTRYQNESRSVELVYDKNEKRLILYVSPLIAR